MNRTIPVFMLLLAACTPQQRLTRLMKHHPELALTDTLWRSDTVLIRENSKDSVFSAIQKDTVILQQGRLTMRYYTTRDSVYLQGKCAADTIIRQIPVVQQKLLLKDGSGWWKWLIAGVLLAMGAAFIFRRVKIIR